MLDNIFSNNQLFGKNFDVDCHLFALLKNVINVIRLQFRDKTFI